MLIMIVNFLLFIWITAILLIMFIMSLCILFIIYNFNMVDNVYTTFSVYTVLVLVEFWKQYSLEFLFVSFRNWLTIFLKLVNNFFFFLVFILHRLFNYCIMSMSFKMCIPFIMYIMTLLFIIFIDIFLYLYHIIYNINIMQVSTLFIVFAKETFSYGEHLKS